MTVQYNVTLYGNVTNTDGILSGFGENSYAELPNVFNPSSSDTWEICIRCTPGSAQGAMLGSGSNDDSGVYLIRASNGDLFPLIRGDNSDIAGWDEYGTWTSSSTEVDIKLSYDGSKYTWDVGGSTKTISNSTPIRIATQPFVLGNNGDMSGLYIDGNINLNGSYIKVNNQYVWQGVTYSYNGVHIQLRRDTASNWTSVNPILYEGEVGLITDQSKYVVGDGTTAYNSLTKHNMDTDLSGYADTNLSNITATAKHTIGYLSIPVSPGQTVIASSSDSIALPASGTSYYASKNGYIYIYMQFTSGFAILTNSTNDISGILNASSFGDFALIPAKKGDYYTLDYSGATSISYYVYKFLPIGGNS